MALELANVLAFMYTVQLSLLIQAINELFSFEHHFYHILVFLKRFHILYPKQLPPFTENRAPNKNNIFIVSYICNF